VYAVDIARNMIEHINEVAQQEHIANRLRIAEPAASDRIKTSAPALTSTA